MTSTCCRVGLRLLVIAVLLVPAVASGQDAPSVRRPLPPVAMGARVKVHSSSVGGSMSGNVAALDREFLTLAPEEGPKLQVALDDITRLEVSRGEKHNVIRGLWMGAVAGAAASFLFVPTGCTGPDPYTEGWKCNKGAKAAVFAVAGAAGGAATGYLWKTERWALVPLDREPTAYRFLGPQVAVSFRF
jgi:hypothetical protein